MAVLVGCDFSSSPTARKPIVMAWGKLHGQVVVLERLELLPTLQAFEQWLARPTAWVAGFDMPFGLPRELTSTLGWPLVWETCIRHYAALDRADIRSAFAAFCEARPAGAKFAHRLCDGPAGSSPSMKWVNPPVAFMLHAGVPRLLEAGVELPGLHVPVARYTTESSAERRVALEAYPGLLARELLGKRSYKSDHRAKQTPERLIARKDLLTGLEAGQTRLGLRLKLTHAQRDALVDDAKGDALDAVLCLVQAAWGQRRHALGDPLYGLPADMDPLEGWILTA
ncbi:MAG: DUF429 domain-containing protein [Pseudomonadota bacterium]